MIFFFTYFVLRQQFGRITLEELPAHVTTFWINCYGNDNEYRILGTNFTLKIEMSINQNYHAHIDIVRGFQVNLQIKQSLQHVSESPHL